MIALAFRTAILAAGGLLAAAPVIARPPAPAIAVLADRATASALDDAVAMFRREHPGTAISVEYAGSREIAGRVQMGGGADVVVLEEGLAHALAGRVGDVHAVERDHTALVANARLNGTPADRVLRSARLGGGAPGSQLAVLQQSTLNRVDGQAAARYARSVALVQSDRARGLLAEQVASGDVDAAVLFAADVVPGRSVEIPLPATARVNVLIDAAVTDSSSQPRLAAAFVGLLRSTRGAALFRARGHDALTI